MTATRMRDHRYIGGFSAISYRASSFPPPSLSFRLFLAPVRVHTYIYIYMYVFFSFTRPWCLPKLDIHSTFPRVVLCNSQ